MGEADFRKLARLGGQAVATYKLIAAGDRILVALSGGKDSFALLHLLRHLRRVAPVAFDLAAVTVDPGFSGFNAAAVAAHCQAYNIEHFTLHLDMPGILESKMDRRRPCVLCSRLRRGVLYKFATENHWNKLALGHHRDDLIVSFMISLCRGQGLTTMGVKVKATDYPVSVIRPMALADEALVKRAAETFAPPEAGRCAYHDMLESDGDRAAFKRRLAVWRASIPDLDANIMHSLSNIQPGWLLDTNYLSD